METAGQKMNQPFALGVVAFGVIMAVCYVAGSLLETVLVSILLAIFLDPGVELLRRCRIPRSVSALLMVLLLFGVVYLAFLLLYSRAEEFAAELPRYAELLRSAVSRIRGSIVHLLEQTQEVLAPSREQGQSVSVGQRSWLAQYLFPGIESLYNFLLMVSFIPFLVFFMLTWKEHFRRGFVELFEENKHPEVARTLAGITSMVHSFILANLLVGLILSLLSFVLFLVLGLDFPFILGFVSGFLNLVPYLGAVLAASGPVLVALNQFQTIGPYIVLVGGVSGFHLIALNLLIPKVVGAKVNLNPVVVTLAILVWGWMWGASGLILAIPITAAAKAVCDHVPELAKFGKLLGE